MFNKKNANIPDNADTSSKESGIVSIGDGSANDLSPDVSATSLPLSDSTLNTSQSNQTTAPTGKILKSDQINDTTNNQGVNSETTPEISIADQAYHSIVAHDIHTAINDGSTSQLISTLESISPSDINSVRTNYNSTYDKPLIQTIKEMIPQGSTEYQKAILLLQGKPNLSKAFELGMNLQGSEADINNAVIKLNSYSRQELGAINDAYKQVFNSDIQSKIDGLSNDFAKNALSAALNNDLESAKINSIALGLTNSPNPETIRSILKNPPPVTYETISEGIKNLNGQNIEGLINNIPDPAIREEISNVLKGDATISAIHTIERISSTNSKSYGQVIKLLANATLEQRSNIVTEYENKFKKPLLSTLQDRFKSNQVAQLQFQYLLNSTHLKNNKKLRDTIEEILASDDPETVAKLIASLSPEELQELEREIISRRSKTLQKIIETGFKGVKEFELELGLTGEAETLEDEHILVNARHEFERKGLNYLASRIIDLYTRKGKQLDESVNSANEYYNTFLEYQNFIHEEEEAKYQTLLGIIDSQLAQYRNDRTSFAARGARRSSMIAAVIALVIVETLDYWVDSLNQPVIFSIMIAILAGIVAERTIQPYLENRILNANSIVDKVKKRRASPVSRPKNLRKSLKAARSKAKHRKI